VRKFLVGLIVSAIALAVEAESPAPAALPEAAHSGIGYPTVQAALTALRSKSGVRIQQKEGWTTVSDKESDNVFVLWSFTPSGHPAHPSAVKRTIYDKDGEVFIEMNVLCQAAKAPCDDLVRQFQALNQSIKEEVRRKGAQAAPAGPGAQQPGH
jgi:hypothetical protein